MYYPSRRKDDDMKVAEVWVSGCRCETVRLEPIPRGIVGAVVAIEYTDAAWDDLRKTVVFRGAVTKDVLDAGNEVTIPAEVVSKAGGSLYMGVYGVGAENQVVIPTIWTELGVIQGAATPSGDASTSPALPVWAQIQSMVGDLDALDTEVKSNLVAAVNEALTKGSSEIDTETVQEIVEDCLKANPPQTGADGKDGITPTIGENGNWYLGNTDTGKPSRGATGAKGADGANGKDGAKGEKGEPGEKGDKGDAFTYADFTTAQLAALKGEKGDKGDPGAKGEPGSDAAVTAANIRTALGYTPVRPGDVPTALKNPNALTIETGSVTVTYDGSAAKTVKIAQSEEAVKSCAEIQWHKVADVITEEELNEYVVNVDSEGNLIESYHPLALALYCSLPADSTQATANGAHYVYPSASSTDASLKASGSFVQWKTTAKCITDVFFGSGAGIVGMGNSTTMLNPVGKEDSVLDGVRIVFPSAGDHFPIGSHIIVSVLGVKP